MIMRFLWYNHYKMRSMDVMVLKRLDILLIICFMVLSFIPQLVFTMNNNNYSDKYVEIKVNGKVYKNIDFQKLEESMIVEINNKNGHNEILISKDCIKMISANCRDGICLKEGEISKVGERIVCLPHNVIVSIKGKNNEFDEDIIVR